MEPAFPLQKEVFDVMMTKYRPSSPTTCPKKLEMAPARLGSLRERHLGRLGTPFIHESPPQGYQAEEAFVLPKLRAELEANSQLGREP